MPARKEVDADQILDLVEKGYTKQQVADALGLSTNTLSKRIAELRVKQGVLLEYRQVQSLHLTELQARILEAITPSKIDGASLKDLCMAYKILASHEGELDLDSGKVKGLLSYLLQLEKDDMQRRLEAEGAIEVEVRPVEQLEGIPNLA